jgi:glycerophosphoryl diester phosphodiesterase
MFGQPRFVEQNAQLNAAFEHARPLVAVHRGTGLGTIAENTQPAVEAALRQGAEMVEIDIVESTDGEFFLFHDGYDPCLGVPLVLDGEQRALQGGNAR